MKRLLREPLVHFLLAGAALVAASSLVPERGLPRDDRIVVGEGQIEHLAARFARTWRRPPTAVELAGLVDEHVREEMAYREGTALGLVEGDAIIRRRVRQKLEFIALDIASMAEPGEENLAAYLAANPDQFTEEARFTFVHVFLDPARRGDDLDTDAHRLLEALTRDPDRRIDDMGDPIMIRSLQEERTPGDATATFGPEFAAGLEEGPVGTWFGPIPSTTGLHLVRILDRTEARLPAMEEIRGDVLREWENARRLEVKEEFYESLLDRYEVIVEWPQADAGDGGR